MERVSRRFPAFPHAPLSKMQVAAEIAAGALLTVMNDIMTISGGDGDSDDGDGRH